MSVLNITKFNKIAGDNSGFPFPAPQWPAQGFENLDIGVASVQSEAFDMEDRYIQVVAGADCIINISEDPTASTTEGTYLFAGATLYFGVQKGQKLAVIGA